MDLFIPPYPEYKAYVAVISAWLLAQLIKVVINLARGQKFNFKWIIQTGGMPSSHSSGVASLTTVVGLYYGFGSIIFGITLVFSLITMFDAAGVRRAVGHQASTLNKIVDEIYEKGGVKEERLKELLGHTPVEVFAGAFLGIVMGLLICH